MSVNQKKEDGNFKVAREITHKFEFYFIALVFTILGMSIQTSSMMLEFKQYVFEIIAWVTFLISGLAGLSRLEWMGVYYRQHGALNENKQTHEMLDQGVKGRPVLKSHNQTWTKQELESERLKWADLVSYRENEIKKISKWVSIKYEIHKLAFVIGLIVLIIARSISGLNGLLF